jgi:L-seryl-tRNA(Ser) seleniumtransferase
MGIYEELGIRPLINAHSTITRIGGSIMPPEVISAMAAAANCFVEMHELQRRVGEQLAQLTHNEAAYVSSGAAGGLALATAACVAGTDPAAIRQLPDLTGLKNEVIIHRSHRNGYDHPVRGIGVKLVEIGYVMGAFPWELEHAITPQTAAVLWFQGPMTGHGDLPLKTVIEIASARQVPVIVDASAQLPPTENLWRFTEMGASLVIFSGGKDLHGPQSSGLIVGRKNLIEAVRANGSPNHAIGRPMKVSKEEMIGLLTAVRLYLEIDQESRKARDEETVARWCQALNRIPGVQAERSFPNEAGQPLPRMAVHLDATRLGKTRDQVVDLLAAGDPAIIVALAAADGIFVNPMTLSPGEDQIVLDRLLETLQAV